MADAVIGLIASIRQAVELIASGATPGRPAELYETSRRIHLDSFGLAILGGNDWPAVRENALAIRRSQTSMSPRPN